MTNMEDDDIHGSGKWWWEMMRGKMSHRWRWWRSDVGELWYGRGGGG